MKVILRFLKNILKELKNFSFNQLIHQNYLKSPFSNFKNSTFFYTFDENYILQSCEKNNFTPRNNDLIGNNE